MQRHSIPNSKITKFTFPIVNVKLGQTLTLFRLNYLLVHTFSWVNNTSVKNLYKLIKEKNKWNVSILSLGVSGEAFSFTIT